MQALEQLADVLLHLDKHLNDLATWMGPWLYLVLFVVIFCETGLVVTPFLPGDSLLFAVGALAATPGTPLQLPLLVALLFLAAVLGDFVNYQIGYRVGPKVFTSEHSRLFSKKNLLYTHEFYERWGGKTIVIARFVPIVRTFAPFVAGIGRMGYRRFSVYNVSGGLAWVLIFLLGGYQFGNLETVRNNFSLVIFGIIGVSVLPAVFEVCRGYLLSRREKKAAAAGAQGALERHVLVSDQSAAGRNGEAISPAVPADR